MFDFSNYIVVSGKTSSRRNCHDLNDALLAKSSVQNGSGFAYISLLCVYFVSKGFCFTDIREWLA